MAVIGTWTLLNNYPDMFALRFLIFEELIVVQISFQPKVTSHRPTMKSYNPIVVKMSQIVWFLPINYQLLSINSQKLLFFYSIFNSILPTSYNDYNYPFSLTKSSSISEPKYTDDALNFTY